MRPRRLLVTPRAHQEFRAIIAWYREVLGAKAAAKATRTIKAGIRATTTISLTTATRPDLPNGYYRAIAKAHVVIFRVEGDVTQVIRILHGARDLSTFLDEA